MECPVWRSSAVLLNGRDGREVAERTSGGFRIINLKNRITLFSYLRYRFADNVYCLEFFGEFIVLVHSHFVGICGRPGQNCGAAGVGRPLCPAWRQWRPASLHARPRWSRFVTRIIIRPTPLAKRHDCRRCVVG